MKWKIWDEDWCNDQCKVKIAIIVRLSIHGSYILGTQTSVQFVSLQCWIFPQRKIVICEPWTMSIYLRCVISRCHGFWYQSGPYHFLSIVKLIRTFLAADNQTFSVANACLKVLFKTNLSHRLEFFYFPTKFLKRLSMVSSMVSSRWPFLDNTYSSSSISSIYKHI